jgi:hypothetical protein
MSGTQQTKVNPRNTVFLSTALTGSRMTERAPARIGSTMRSLSSNLLLSSLGPSELASLRPHLRPFSFEQGKILYESGDRISGVYFPFDAIVRWWSFFRRAKASRRQWSVVMA